MSAAVTARVTGISEDELVRFVDFSEQRARDLIAAGVPMAAAVNRAADETVELARTLGLFGGAR